MSRLLLVQLAGILEEEIGREKKIWVRELLTRRSTHGYSALLLKELHAEDPAEHRAADKENIKLFIQNHTLCVNTRAPNLFEHVVATDSSRQVGVHTRQVKGRLPAGGGEGRQAA
jgi:hypothetical protein